MAIISATIKPQNKKGPLVVPSDNGRLVIYVKEPAIDGKANNAAIAALAEYYKVAKSCIQLKKGQTSRFKTFLIDSD